MFKHSSIPWNKDKANEQKLPFSYSEVQRLIVILLEQQKPRELALLTCGIDSMLRVSDLLRLKVGDLYDSLGNIKTEFSTRQKKTSEGVYTAFTPLALKFLEVWIQQSKKNHDDHIFTSFRRGYEHKALTESGFRDIVKSWARLLELDASLYSTHSLRRTKPAYLHLENIAIEIIATLLGHEDPKSTMRYLGIDRQKARQIALEYDIFTTKGISAQKAPEVKICENQLDQLVDKIVDKAVTMFFDKLLNHHQFQQLADTFIDEVVNRLHKKLEGSKRE